jgi:hypothetical protein
VEMPTLPGSSSAIRISNKMGLRLQNSIRKASF